MKNGHLINASIVKFGIVLPPEYLSWDIPCAIITVQMFLLSLIIQSSVMHFSPKAVIFEIFSLFLLTFYSILYYNKPAKEFFTDFCIVSINIIIQIYVNVNLFKEKNSENGKNMETYKIIKELCDSKNIKMSVLAANIGIRSSVFSELKMGRTKQLSTATLQKIAAYFEVPLSTLVEEELSAVEEKQNELFRKRKLLFDLSQKASEEDLDKMIKIFGAIIGE